MGNNRTGVLDTIIAATATRVEPIAVWLVDHFGEGCDYCGLKFRRKRFSDPRECSRRCETDWAEGDGF